MIVFFLLLLAFSPILLAVKSLPTKYFIASILLIIVYVLLAYVNGCVYNFKNLQGDSNSFYHLSLLLSNNPSLKMGIFDYFLGGPLTNWYPSLVSYLYRYSITNSIIIGSLVSIFGYSCSFVLLWAFIKKLGVEKYTIPILLLFSLHPEHLLDSVGFLRESWELLFMMLATYSLMCLVKKERMLSNLFALIILLWLGRRLHYGFYYIGLAMCVWLVYSLTLRNTLKSFSNKWGKRTIIFLVVLFVYALIYRSPALMAKYNNSYLYYTKGYGVHSSYIKMTELNHFYTPAWLFVNYMFAPFIFNVRSAVDFLAFSCSCLRLLLIYFSIRRFSTLALENKTIFFSCVSAAFIFSQGTGSYGAALRHHILTYWGLVILGVPGAVDFINKLLRSVAKGNCLDRKRDLETG
jgi:hypothetical protein